MGVASPMDITIPWSVWESWEESDDAVARAECARTPARSDDGGGLPAGLDDMAPGPALAAILASLDLSTLSAEDRVVALRAEQRLVGHVQANTFRALASIIDAYRELLGGSEGDADEELVWDAATAEVSAALRWTRRAASRELDQAGALAERLPAVQEALAEGRIDRPRAWVMIRETTHVDAETARRVVDRLLDRASGLTTGQLASRLRKAIVEVDPDQAEDRYRETLTERRVVAEQTDDGTANLLVLDGPPEAVAEARDRIDRIARSLKRRGETRSMDQLRADVALDLLRRGQLGPVGRGGPGGRVELRVDLETLAGLSEAPGELAGFGPVIADIARQTAEKMRRWEFAVTDPDSGEVVHTGTTRRRPTAAQARRVRARYRSCTFPGCRMPAIDCDIDHRVPWGEGGLTVDCNLVPLCRFHHRMRHEAGWRHLPLPDGDHLWISPLGFRSTTSGRDP